MIICVAVVGLQNNPLYIQSFTDGDDALKLHYIVHCSLDVIDERVNNPKKIGSTLNETYLGLLYPSENYKVYGYLTNTKVKFILVTTDEDLKDADVRSVEKSEHITFTGHFSFVSCRILLEIVTKWKDHRHSRQPQIFSVLQTVSCCICGCCVKSFPRARKENHFMCFC